MGYRFERKKPFNFATSLVYRLGRLPFASSRAKVRLFSDLSWIFDRLFFEYSFRLLDVSQHPAFRNTLHFLRSRIGSTAEVLDVGCGTGEHAFALSAMCKRVVGIDTNAGLIESARLKFKSGNLDFVLGDATKYPLESGRTFDTIVCSHVLEHLEAPGQVLASLRAHCRYLFIEVPDFDRSYANGIRMAIDILPIYTDDDHIYEFSRGELEKLIVDNGFAIVDSEFSHGVMRYWTMWPSD